MRSNRLPEVDNNRFNVLKVRKDEWSKLLSIANAVSMISGPGVRRYGDRIYIDQPRTFKAAGTPGSSTLNLQFAAIVEEPSDTAELLKVRRVEYISPPKGTIEDGPARYKFKGEAFDAVPFPGFQASEYKEHVQDETAPPNEGDYFLLAMLEEKLGVIGPPPAPLSDVSIATFQSEQADYVTATRGEDTILVAKPYLLRRTPFHNQTRGNVRYVYNADGTRVARAPAIVTGATPRDLVETQRIIPFYVVGDKLSVVKIGRDATGVTTPTGGAVEYVDMNTDGRTWARYTAGVVFTT